MQATLNSGFPSVDGALARPERRSVGPHADAPAAPAGAARPAATTEISRAALQAVRSDVGGALTALDRAIEAGRQAGGFLAEALALSRAGALAPEIERTLRRYDYQIAEGGPLLAGEDLRAAIDPRSEPVEIAGADLRRTGPAGEGPGEVEALQALRVRLDATLAQLAEQGVRLSAHGSLVERLNTELRASIAPDLSAEEARLMALQVGQSLARAETGAANAVPHAILALFRD